MKELVLINFKGLELKENVMNEVNDSGLTWKGEVFDVKVF